MEEKATIYVVTYNDGRINQPMRAFASLADANNYAEHLFRDNAHTPLTPLGDWPDEALVERGWDGCEHFQIYQNENDDKTLVVDVTQVLLE